MSHLLHPTYKLPLEQGVLSIETLDLCCLHPGFNVQGLPSLAVSYRAHPGCKRTRQATTVMEFAEHGSSGADALINNSTYKIGSAPSVSEL